jgi:hypothetical protein
MLANEILLKSIFESFQLLRIQQLIDKIINNKLIASKLLNILRFKKIFKSMGRDKTTLEGPKHYVKNLVLLPDGTILSAGHYILKFWNPDNCQCIATIEENKAIRSLITLPERKFEHVYLPG